MKLPLFPLPVFLLPNGITRLRIFEQRYLKMVRIATKENGFAILLNKQDPELPETNWASWVEIINFDQDSDGTLIIDVKCKSLVVIDTMTVDKDKLHYAEVSPMQHWPSAEHDSISNNLSASLAKVFAQNNELNQLYQNQFIDKANWIIARWLELLPVELIVKDIFVGENSLEQAKQFVHNIITAEQTH